MHWEGVRVLKVVRQQNGPCHDDQLEIKHIGSSFRTASRGSKRVGKEEWKIYNLTKKKEKILLFTAKMMDASVMCKCEEMMKEGGRQR